MTDAARPDDGEPQAEPQDAAPHDAGSPDPWAPPQDDAPQDARPAGAPWPPPRNGPYPHPYAQVGPYPHPYAQVGPYPYPYDGRPVVEGTNGLAITSLVTGVTCCLWPAALGFGIAALVQLRRRRQEGFGIAIAGVVLGTLGLIGGTVGMVSGVLHVHASATGAGPSTPALPFPLPSDIPSDPGGSADLNPTQQAFVQDLTELRLQDEILQDPMTDPGMAGGEAERTAQVLADTEVFLDQTQWPAEVKGQIAVLVNSFEADATVWNAVSTNTTDPVGAFQAALRTNAPSIAEAIARKALSLTEDNQPVDPGNGIPGDPSSTQPTDSAAPAAV
ncbi:DUF4190 domain-containing protein [Kitasatospora sp. GAS1066B]|uniref:DUF4190 domain-containing protein n=1 Tax=Kitasatospora sp. GAS1066B TaxID=3156271 RepID=UPI0035173395